MGVFLLNVHERWNMIYRIRVMRESRNISVLQKNLDHLRKTSVDLINEFPEEIMKHLTLSILKSFASLLIY